VPEFLAAPKRSQRILRYNPAVWRVHNFSGRSFKEFSAKLGEFLALRGEFAGLLEMVHVQSAKFWGDWNKNFESSVQY
jgi:hypothetical protein